MSEPHEEFDADRETFEQANPTPQDELDELPDYDPDEPDVPEQGA